MKATIQNLRRAVEAAGGKLEEDTGLRDMRNLQMVAPDGKIWSEGVVNARVGWATGSSPHAKTFNEAALKSALERIAVREMDAQERDFYTEAAE